MPRGRPKKILDVKVDLPSAQERTINNIMPDETNSPVVESSPIPEPMKDLSPLDEPQKSVNPADNYKRSEVTGLLENVEYTFNEDGTVNWLAMIPKRYFVINKQATSETDIEKVDDKNKLILLAGFKHLAFLRGYIGERPPDVVSASPDYVAMTTTIEWMPNFETNGYAVTRSGTADAWSGNVSSKKAPNGFVATNFLMTIAENRSFVRAVKNFLNISVLGQDEVSLNEDSSNTTAPEPVVNSEARKILDKLLNDNGISFEQFKNAINRYVSQGQLKDLSPESWEVLDQIPPERIAELTRFMKDRLEEKKAAKKPSQ